MRELKVGPDDVHAIRKVTRSLRRRARLRTPHYSTQRLINACFPGTRVTGRDLPSNVHEMVLVDEGAFRSHRAPHTIVYQRALSSDEQRRAIAHALAHIIFDGGRPVPLEHRADAELRCDRFADELLVPLDELRDWVEIWPSFDFTQREAYLDQCDLLAATFRVPAKVIDQRIRELP